MSVQIFDDYDDLSLQVATAIASQIKHKPESVICIAAGDTPRRACAQLARLTEEQKLDVSECTFVGLDEWVGIPPDNEGSCHFFLQNNLFQPLRIAPSQIHLFNALAKDLANECAIMDDVIRDKRGIDLMVVGVGMNGHIGFNEPGVSENHYSHVVALDATTRSVGQKYFRESTRLEKGITLGFRHLLESKNVIMMASGQKKADIIRQALEGRLSTEVPASIIRKHPAGVTMLDRDAASLLTLV